ncbi:MAG TPA: S46 family peptidase [Planctomycetota bacterium]|nr:S46 family peptidase [Planctomycetota bacterium]
MFSRSLLSLLAAVCLLPDEGQWLPTQVREMDWTTLQKRGMQLSKDEFWHPERGGVLSATVQINGCTAAFVSQDGLLVTNHHCGFSAVSDLSTPEKNFLRDGFVAADRSAELAAPGMVALVLKRIEDVTRVVHEAQQKAKDDLERWGLTQDTIARLVADGEKMEANTKCSVASFLEGKEYHLYYRTEIRDVRLVYAPPRAIGEFGGEVDNWEWPRHTGDFTFFRAYVAKDGQVRDFDKENVPYQPTHFLAVSQTPVKEGDLAIIMGYPGRTQRYKSSRGVATQQGYVYPRREHVLTRAIAVLEAAAKTSEKKALEVADTIKSLANVQKNAAGMNFGLAQNSTAERKRREEEQFREWVKEHGDKSWQGVLDEVFAMDEAEAQTIERDTMMWFLGTLGAEMPLLTTLIQACGASAALAEGKLPPRLQAVLGEKELTKEFDLIERPMLEVMLAEFAAMSGPQRLAGTKFLGESSLDKEAVTRLFRDTKMLDALARSAAFTAGKEALAQSDDPLLVLARGLAAERAAAGLRQRQRAGKMLDVGRRWIAAQEAFRGKAFYPDANSTLRISIAEVSGYVSRDGTVRTPHTTVAGLLEKETGREPFANPKAVLEAAKNRKQSRWFDKVLGDVPVCFLTNGDTTGGNSGSPVINGKGQLIGLNFDRVFEGVAGDFGWSADRSRNVVCDIRYVLWIVESVFPSPRLLAELGA